MDTSLQAKLISIHLKEGESPEKIKQRILRRLKKLEKSPTTTSHVKGINGLVIDDVYRVVSNSQYIVFLMKDGRVCRLRVSSSSKLTRYQLVPEITSRRSHDPSFQVLSDAEYARRLQAQFDQERSSHPGRFNRELDILRGLNNSTALSYVALPSWNPSSPPPLVPSQLNTNFTVAPSSPTYSPASPTYVPGSPVYTPINAPYSVSFSSSLQDYRPPSPLHLLEPALGRQSSEGAMAATPTPVIGDTQMDMRDASEENKLRSNESSQMSKAKEEVWPDIGTLEWLIVKQNPDSLSSDSQFSHAAALHSEILLVGGATGQLYSWPCGMGVVNPQPHPLNGELELQDDRIVLLSSNEIRASLVTESGRTATFYDQMLRSCSESGTPPLINSLSHSAIVYPEFVNDPVTSLSVSEFITIAMTTSGKVYWWGLCPQAKSSISLSDDHTPSSTSTITQGSLVRLKNGPPCGANALVLQCSKTHGPRVGQTVNIIEQSSLDPTTTVLVKVLHHPGLKDQVYESLEVWKQSDVVFLDDSPAVLGRVVAVDNNQAIIDISYAHETQSTSSKSQGSLKVFKVSELALCVGVDSNLSNETTPPTTTRSLSRHVAGIVQHHPVCLLDPAPQLSVIDDINEGSMSTRTTLVGFSPLAIHPTNSGPYLLVKRCSDDKAFIICTNGTSSGLLQSSSFVAVGGRDQKPHKCTIEEESCHSKECGLEAWFLEKVSTPIPNEKGKRGGRKRKRKLAQRDILTETSTDVFPLNLCQKTASFINLYNSEVLCLQDIHGILIPIPAGLKLKPTQPRFHDRISGWLSPGQSREPTLSLPYKGIVCRQYTVNGSNKKVLLLTVVPKLTKLLPAVMKMDTLGVERIIQSIANNSQVSSSNGVESNENDPDVTPAKRPMLNMSHNDVTASADSLDEDIDMENKPSEIEFSSQMSIDTELCFDPQTQSGMGFSLTRDVLYECTAHNCNILHVCTARRDDDDKYSKQFIPFKGDMGLSYQSMTAYPEYHQTSFEELRHTYYSKRGYDLSSPDMKRDWQDLVYAQVMILDTFLSCEAIKNDVVKLLCQKNAFGETPFMTALAYQNFTGALKIINFIDDIISTSSADNESLFEQAILTRNREGLTPLQMFFASYGSCYDTLNMKLYVSSLPLGYTAQQLLSLFKECYPSVYRAEVTQDLDEDLDNESTEPESEDETDPQLSAVGLTSSTGNVTRRPRTTPNSGLVDNNIPLRGVVYFSDIHQLRAAHQEMQDFRVFSNYNSSRGGSFGQAHSVSFLSVGLEPEETNEEENTGEEGFPTLLDVGHGIVSRVTPARRIRGGGFRVGWGTNKPAVNMEAKREARNKKASACLREAASLLCVLLSKPEIVTAQDNNGETTVTSLIHNQRCLSSFKKLSCSPPYSKHRRPLIPNSKSDKKDETSIIPGSMIALMNEPLDVINVNTPVSDEKSTKLEVFGADPVNNETTPTSLWRPFGTETASETGPVLKFGEGNPDSELPQPTTTPVASIAPPTSLPRQDCDTCALHGIEYLTGYDLVHNLYMNWPILVTTILGFNPLVSHSTPPIPTSIQDLDNFVTSLFVSNECSLIMAILSCLSKNMNAALANGEKLSSVDIHNMEGITPGNLALYVGMRYLGAVVRTLALEHSRVKGTLVELPSSRDRMRSQLLQGRLIHDMIKTTLTSFSWLAVDVMARAAETACLPVRMGVAKPFGASSVTNDYQSHRMHSSMRSITERGLNRTRSLVRQFHVRSALVGTEEPHVLTQKTTPTPPISGIKLIPQHRGSQLSQEEEFGMDLSDSDVPDTANDSFEGTPVVRGYTPHAEVYASNDYIRPNFVHFGDSSSSDEDDPFGDIVEEGLGRHGNTNARGGEDGESEMDGIYPYAWALDGRRIGENTPVVRPASPTSSFFGHGEITTPLCTIPSIRFGSGFLARSFSRVTKDLVDIVHALCCSPRRPLYVINLPDDVIPPLIESTITTLDKTWSWLVDVLDVAEGQLKKGKMFDTQRYVATLRGSIRATSPSTTSSVVQRIISRTASKSFIGSTPGEYITYLLRSQTHEDEGCLPVIDLYGYEHVVYILDGLMYTLNNWPKMQTQSLLNKTMMSSQTNENAESDAKTDDDVESVSRKRSASEERFFARTESIVDSEEEVQKCNAEFFGTAASPVPSSGPLQEAFPLAKQPHLLKPYARKEQLFSSPNPTLETSQKESRHVKNSCPPLELPISYMHLNKRTIKQPVTLQWTTEETLKRWNTSISVFAHIFLAEGPGSERDNFLNARAGFASRMARFRHQVSQLFESTQTGRGDWASVSNTLSIRVRRDHLLEDALEYLGHMTKFHYSQIRVKFEGEDGSGPGVNRGFFASLANAIKHCDITKPPCNKIGGLFYQPGKEPEQSGLFAPQPFVIPQTCSSVKSSALRSQRLNIFKAIGRFIGLCFWFKHTIPFMVCRHVAKYLLDRDSAWHDLAFYNADLYEGLRRMMMDAKSGKSKEEFQGTYCCYFEAPVSGQLLTGQSTETVFTDLIPGGSKIPVTPDRVEEYVRLYARFVMVGCIRDELMSMRSGLTDVIPPELLVGLTAEDFQLLLSGDSASISLQRLKSVMKFNHTHGRPPNICDRFEKMFWRVVSHMNNTQRQQLLYFATGSASLPVSSDQEPSSVSINIDVIGGGNTDSLPVASTCSQRMSIPLYPSYNTLKRKLMQAIQCQAYGLG